MNSNYVVNNVNANMSNVIVKMVDEMKVTIATAIRKIAVENPAIPPPPTAEEAREAFIEMLLKELFGEASVSVPMTPAPVAVKAPEKVPEKPKKPRAPRAKKEKVAEAVPEVDSVAEPEAVPEAVPEPVAEVKEAPKKEPKAKKPAAKKEKPVAEPAAPAAPAEPKTVNIDKLTPTHTKKIKAIADEIKVAVPDKKLVLAYLNGLTSEVYNSKKMDEHLRTFLTPAPPAPAAIPAEMVTLPASPKEDEDVPEDYDDVGNLPAPVPNTAPAEEGEIVAIDAIEVVFKGKVYYVDPTTKKVYNDTDAYVGDVGVNLFKGMVLPA
jgi:hypothetical protein